MLFILYRFECIKLNSQNLLEIYQIDLFDFKLFIIYLNGISSLNHFGYFESLNLIFFKKVLEVLFISLLVGM